MGSCARNSRQNSGCERDDTSAEARALLSKLVEDRGVSDMMITLADWDVM